jgi:tripartite-type tricarboxylate transporter receptor subunit TctC
MSFLKSLAIAAIAGFCAVAPSVAQTFPDRPIHIVVPQPPGGGFDTVARVMADRLSAILGQPVIVDNKPGAGTLVGTDFAAKAAPDGYTLLLGGTSNMALNLGLYPKLSYDPVKDFTPVGLVVSWPFMLLTRKDLPYKTVKDVVEAAKAKPDAITFASAGIGSGQHVATAVFAYLAGIKLTHVPYSGAQAAYGDLLGGRVDLFSDNAQTAMPQVRGDTVRALAVTTAKRYAVMPDLPTIAESGLSNIDMETWFGLFAPAATPAPVLAKLTEAVEKARSSPEAVDIFTKTGGSLKTMGIEETRAFARNEAERWAKLLREAGIRAE